MTIKVSLGKLKTKASIQEMWLEMFRIQIDIIPIEIKHLEYLQQLPFHHGDPFDRTIVSQAQANNCTIITKDQTFAKYAIQTL